jgi:hypothetical protein
MLLCKELLLGYVAYMLTQGPSCIPCLKIGIASVHVGGIIGLFGLLYVTNTATWMPSVCILF